MGLPWTSLLEPRGGRGDPHRRHQRQLRRGLGRGPAEQVEHAGRLLGRPRDGAREDLGAHRVERVLDARQDAEVPAPAPEPPEEVGVLVLARVHEAAVGRRDVHGEDVVARPPEAARGVPEASAQGEPGDSGGGDEAEDGQEAVELRLPVHVAEEAARLGPGDPGPRVHPHATHQREVEHQAAVGHARGPRCCGRRPSGRGRSRSRGRSAGRRGCRRRRCTARREPAGGRSSRSRSCGTRRSRRRRRGAAARAARPAARPRASARAPGARPPSVIAATAIAHLLRPGRPGRRTWPARAQRNERRRSATGYERLIRAEWRR